MSCRSFGKSVWKGHQQKHHVICYLLFSIMPRIRRASFLKNKDTGITNGSTQQSLVRKRGISLDISELEQATTTLASRTNAICASQLLGVLVLGLGMLNRSNAGRMDGKVGHWKTGRTRQHTSLIRVSSLLSLQNLRGYLTPRLEYQLAILRQRSGGCWKNQT